MKQENNLKSLDQFVEEQYGKIGTPKRDKLEKGYESFRLGFQLQQARLEKGMTQEELALKCGTNNVFRHFKKLLNLDLEDIWSFQSNCNAPKIEKTTDNTVYKSWLFLGLAKCILPITFVLKESLSAPKPPRFLYPTVIGHSIPCPILK
jgi:hypothetical protein